MECPICLDGYNASDKKPMSLECGHSLCRPCLESLFKAKRACPIDRIRISKSLDEIPINYGLLQIIETTASISSLSLHSDSPSKPSLPNKFDSVPFQPPKSKPLPIPRSMNLGSTRVLELKPQMKQDRTVLNPKEALQGEFRKRNVVVKNLPCYSKETLLRTLFKDYGEIESVKVITEEKTNRDASGKIQNTIVAKGTAFVLFRLQSSAEKAIEERNGFKIDDKKLFLQMWKPKDEWTKRPKKEPPSFENNTDSSSNPVHPAPYIPIFEPQQMPQQYGIQKPFNQFLQELGIQDPTDQFTHQYGMQQPINQFPQKYEIKQPVHKLPQQYEMQQPVHKLPQQYGMQQPVNQFPQQYGMQQPINQFPQQYGMQQPINQFPQQYGMQQPINQMPQQYGMQQPIHQFPINNTNSGHMPNSSYRGPYFKPKTASKYQPPPQRKPNSDAQAPNFQPKRY